MHFVHVTHHFNPFLLPGTGLGTEYPCPAGTYSNTYGNIRVEDCEECTPGHYCLEASTAPTPCPV